MYRADGAPDDVILSPHMQINPMNMAQWGLGIGIAPYANHVAMVEHPKAHRYSPADREEKTVPSERWYGPIRTIHDQHFHDPWEERLTHLNASLGLHGDNVFLTHGPGLPPPWFNGDIEAIKPGEWVLVISLNPRLNPRNPSAQHWYRDQGFTTDTYWDHWRRFNENHWYSTFFRPLASLAAGALGLSLDPVDFPRFATDQMLFIELCPYGSQRFTLSRETVEALAKHEVGFRLAAGVRRILIEQGQPALILINGTEALNDIEAVESGSVDLVALNYDSVDVPPKGRKQKRLWHKQGYYTADRRQVPVVGFPFLRGPRTHNSNAERQQLATYIREFLSGG